MAAKVASAVNLLRSVTAFSLAHQAQRKSLAKRKRHVGISPSADGDEGSAPSTALPFLKRRAKNFRLSGLSCRLGLRSKKSRDPHGSQSRLGCQFAQVCYRFFFGKSGAKKKLGKKKAPCMDFAVCGRRRGLRALDCAAFLKKGGRKTFDFPG